MSFCPVCKCEYVQGIEKCPDCDEALVWELPSELPPDHVPPGFWTDEEAVTVFTAKDSVEAEIVRGILESAGIPCYVNPGVTKWARGTSMLGGLQSIDIMVLESKAWEARKIIEEAMEAGSDMPEEM